MLIGYTINAVILHIKTTPKWRPHFYMQ